MTTVWDSTMTCIVHWSIIMLWKLAKRRKPQKPQDNQCNSHIVRQDNERSWNRSVWVCWSLVKRGLIRKKHHVQEDAWSVWRCIFSQLLPHPECWGGALHNDAALANSLFWEVICGYQRKMLNKCSSPRKASHQLCWQCQKWCWSSPLCPHCKNFHVNSCDCWTKSCFFIPAFSGRRKCDVRKCLDVWWLDVLNFLNSEFKSKSQTARGQSLQVHKFGLLDEFSLQRLYSWHCSIGTFL